MSATPIRELCAKATPGPWFACTRPAYTLGGDSIEICIQDAEGFVTDHVAEVLVDTGEDTPEDRRVWKGHEATAELIARCSPEVVAATLDALESSENTLRSLIGLLKTADSDERMRARNFGGEPNLNTGAIAGIERQRKRIAETLALLNGEAGK